MQPGNSLNRREEDKLVDLVCADGLYGDSSGMQGDNLDFWAYGAYGVENSGNQGDSTDPFDGRSYKSLVQNSNPSSVLPGLEGTSGLVIDPIRRRRGAMVVDIRQPRWSGRIDEFTKWKGDVFVGGDLTVERYVRLEVDPTTRVQFDSTTGCAAGWIRSSSNCMSKEI